MISIKVKTILIFTSITILLVLIMARVGYVTVKDNYLHQSSDHIKMLCSYMAASIDEKYLEFISINDDQVKNNYIDFLKEQVNRSGVENAFLFNRSLQILAFAKDGISTTQLQLNKNEILNVNTGKAIVSFPFSDYEDHWYIWGFFRINENFYLGIRESVNRLNILNNLSGIFIGIGIGGIILTVIAGWFIAQNISGPVDKLVRFSKKIGRGEFNASAPEKIYGEFKILKDTMEQMKSDLARKNDEREQMLAQIAHEIRNPLGGIELLVGLVKEDLNKSNTSEMHLQKITDEVQNLKKQLTVFLEYSKPLQVHKQEIDLNKLTVDIEQYFKNKISEKNIRLQTENNVKTIYFDKGHLKQILNNLLSNSLDAAQTGGCIQLFSGQQNGEIVISVSDNGPGIKSENEKNIFVPFFTTKANGTGLGLAISKKLCKENNAELEYKKNENRGCTFMIKVHK